MDSLKVRLKDFEKIQLLETKIDEFQKEEKFNLFFK